MRIKNELRLKKNGCVEAVCGGGVREGEQMIQTHKSLALHKVACSKTEAPQIKDNTILPSHYKHKAR